MAERAGLEFVLPIARWRGFGGETKAREWSFETFTWAAGLAAATSRIGLFMTVHVPLVHPVYAAKALATVDHISNGRAGLNIVCGWNPDEFEMFGTSLDYDVYARAAEWITIVSRPASLQNPRPVTMNAAFGKPGRNFAAAHCDFLFSTFSNIEDGRSHVTDMQDRAKRVGRDVGIYTVCHVVCRETDSEAQAYYQHYAVEQADDAAVDYHMSKKQQFANSHDSAAFATYRKRFAGGAGSYPLVGSPEHIAEQLERICSQGYSGAALSFVNCTDELPFFCERVLPLLESSGLRTKS
jgi:alkanesulfonate monooxygenase SsuD/methylene tetrahydromethanopterin reductase-like flavin-dependent oxidoreductase (luciferase family)